MNMHQPIDEEQVRRVARLSRLELSGAQVRLFAAQLADVLRYVDKLGQLDLEDVEPLAHPTELTGRLREDEPAAPLPVGEVLANAPQADPPYFKVPKVLGEGSGA